MLKRLGEAASPGLLSLPQAGITLALDVRNMDRLENALFPRLDAITHHRGDVGDRRRLRPPMGSPRRRPLPGRARSGQARSVNAPGDASFNAADRLAIINFFGAYAQDYDVGKPGEFPSVFTATVELTYMNGGEVVAEGLAQVTRAMTEQPSSDPGGLQEPSRRCHPQRPGPVTIAGPTIANALARTRRGRSISRCLRPSVPGTA